MALPWLQRAELALFAAAFLCGAVAAAALTRTQDMLQSFLRQKNKSSGATYSTRHSPVSWLLLHNLSLVLKQVGPGPGFILKSDTTVLSYAEK